MGNLHNSSKAQGASLTRRQTECRRQRIQRSALTQNPLGMSWLTFCLNGRDLLRPHPSGWLLERECHTLQWCIHWWVTIAQIKRYHPFSRSGLQAHTLTHVQESSKRVAEKKGFSKRKWREYEESKVGGINYERINKYFKEHFALSGQGD